MLRLSLALFSRQDVGLKDENYSEKTAKDVTASPKGHRGGARFIAPYI